MTRSRVRTAIGVTFLGIAMLGPGAGARAGGALMKCGTDRPYLWPGGGAAIPYNPDRGRLGLLTNPQAVAQTESAFLSWQSVPTSTAGYVNAGLLPIDVDASSFGPFLDAAAPDGLSAVVYDADGSIFRLLFGSASAILGFAGPEWVDPRTCEIIEGMAFLSGGAMLEGFPSGEFLSVQHHEFGHLTNLAHTVVNGQIESLDDNTGPTPFDTFPREDLSSRIETMYPFIFEEGGQDTPHADDVAILSTLYPDPSFRESTGSITGRIVAPDEVTLLTGVNVIARNVDDPFDDAISAISGDRSDPASTSDPLTGVYILNGLTPGAAYAVYVDQIRAGLFSTRLIILPGVEEFHSGAAETNGVFSPDDPSLFEPVVVSAGAVAAGVDIVFNGIPPGPIPLRNNDSREIFLPWSFGFCGNAYDTLFVGSNGNVTFGARDVDETESIGEFLSGPPRIAGLWDDLDPESAGTVSYEVTDEEFTVTFLDVPESPLSGSNSFQITLRRSSDQIVMRFGPVSARDGLSGISCGGSITTGLETGIDLDELSGPGMDTGGRGVPALFERFTEDGNPWDLAEGAELRFRSAKGFKDTGEPNDTLHKATPVSLPFSSADRFTAIDPPGGDVDLFRFQAAAGETVIARVTAAALDSLIGLLDEEGVVLASAGEGGSGAPPTLTFEIPHDGDFLVAVTSIPDSEFVGAGETGGRFVLEIETIPAP